MGRFLVRASTVPRHRCRALAVLSRVDLLLVILANILPMPHLDASRRKITRKATIGWRLGISRGDTELFRPLIDGLLHQDPYLLLADFQSYVECQERVAETYIDEERWTRMSILNAARSGKFSSDRTIREYCRDIWHVKPVPINLLTHAEAGIA